MNDKCFKCKYREVFRGSRGTTLSLCQLDPIEENDEVLWLDVMEFDSDRCLSYKEDTE